MTTSQKQFPKNVETRSRLWPKRAFQDMLTDVRRQGLTVTKLDGGYEMTNNNGVLLLRAMQGNNGYLVRAIADLFT